MYIKFIAKFNLLILTIGFLFIISACEKPLTCDDGYTNVDGECQLIEISCEEDPTQDKCEVINPYEGCKAIGYFYDEENLDYQLVFSDEFDEPELDLSVWRFETGNNNGWGNNELQYYTDGANADIIDGKLVITARYEDYEGYDYTSSRIITRNREDFMYGKFEIRAKLPDARGSWSAIWMLSTDSYAVWPEGGEIDIMEQVGAYDNIVHSTIHTLLYNHKDGTQKGDSYSVENATTEFHTYTLEWLPDKLKFFVDGDLKFTYQPNLYSTCPLDNKWPFDTRFYMIFNIAVGGDWGGAYGIIPEEFPTSMEIDYVRVYQSEIITNLEQGVE